MYFALDIPSKINYMNHSKKSFLRLNGHGFYKIIYTYKKVIQS